MCIRDSFATWWDTFRVDVLKESTAEVGETIYLDHAGKRKLTGKQLFVGGGAKEAEAAPDDDGVDAVGALNEELFEEDEDLDDLDFDDDDDDES